jgi:1-acyl-sn-glycerol-3-phosphate acyltransferase
MSSAVKGFPAKFPVRDDDNPPRRYRIATSLSRLYLRLLSRRRVRTEGEGNIPAAGPLLVACNHTSNLDPMVIGGYFPRTLFVMAKREMFFARPVAWFLAGINCIPVTRGAADRRAVTLALEVLRRGARLLIFVEGTRSRDGRMNHSEVGVAFLARRSGAAVLPIAVFPADEPGGATPRGSRRREIVMRYGVPFKLDMSGPRDDRLIADEIGRRVAALLPASRRGVYGESRDPTPLAPA